LVARTARHDEQWMRADGRKDPALHPLETARQVGQSLFVRIQSTFDSCFFGHGYLPFSSFTDRWSTN